jgi:tRNA(fMet)-specific endonuclease VapC
MLDTNTCIYFLNRSSERIISKLKSLSPSDIRLSTITVAELFFGAEKSRARKKNWTIVEDFVGNFELLPFDGKCCQNYAKIGSINCINNP